MIIKISLYLVGILGFIFLCNWTFNHVDPWLSILICVVGVVGVLNHIYSIVKKQIEKNEKNN